MMLDMIYTLVTIDIWSQVECNHYENSGQGVIFNNLSAKTTAEIGEFVINGSFPDPF